MAYEYKLIRSVTGEQFEARLNAAAADGWRLVQATVRSEKELVAVMERVRAGEQLSQASSDEMTDRLGDG